ncbi:MAG TPA: ABC transporter transmembrane domain-containing protein [Gaiellaceae bacterium]
MSRGIYLMAPFLRRQWRSLVVAALSTAVVAGAELARPFPLKLALDLLIGHGRKGGSFHVTGTDIALLAGITGLVLAIALADAVASYQMDIRLGRAGERIVHDLRVATYAHLQRLSLPFHERRHTGDLVTRLTGDVNAVGDLFSDSLGTLISSALLLSGMVVVSVLIDPFLALAAFALTPILAAVTFQFRRKMKAAARRQRATEGEIASLAEEALSSIREVKAFGSERFEHDRLERKSVERWEAGVETVRIESRFGRLIDLLGAASTALVLVVGVFRVASGAISPGDLVVMASYTRRVYKPLRDIARQAGRVSRAMARADRIAEILAADQVLEERQGAFRGARARGALELDGVSFAYETGRPALVDLSLRISAGERVALVGRSGAGKSTIAALIARFYDPHGGSVRIDGRDARDCAVSWLRDQVGLVLQDTILFTGTVADNIAYGTRATRTEIVAAAKAAGADSFVAQLPQGYDTLLGPRGKSLSGGQRQRIAIARTLLRNPAILVLDEPTTGLDALSESEVLAGLDVLMRGRTTIIITHSLALARTADRALVIESGRVEQEGRPEELLRRQGAFRRLAREQGLTVTAPRTPVPADAVLSHMPQLLDLSEMTGVLERSLDDGAVSDVDVRYLRYKPCTNLVVHYSATVAGRRHDAVAMIAARADLARRARRPETVALARKVNGRSPARVPLSYEPELGAIIHWLPLDLSLPALAESPARLGQALEAVGVSVAEVDEHPDLLAYKPRRRAVIRLGDHVLKIYATAAELRAAELGQRAASGLQSIRTAQLEAVLPEHRSTAQSLLHGRPFVRGPASAGEALALLHASRPAWVRRATATSQLAAAAASARLTIEILPGLGRRLERLLAELERRAPKGGALVNSHGDFHAGQLLDLDEGPALIDFDEMCSAQPALDLTSYAGHLVSGADGDLQQAREALEGLVGGYGVRPPDLPWYLSTSILRRAPFPFRFLDVRWPERVEGMVAAAESALEP